MNKRYLETIKAVDGKLYNLNYHQERLNRALDCVNDKTPHALQKILNPPKNGIYRCRIVYDATSLVIEYIPYDKRFIKSLKLVYAEKIEYSKKYENRDALEQLFMQKENCDDILIVKNGLLTDTSIANIAFYDGKNWLTPKSPLLHGTTRARLLEASKIVEVDIRIEDIKEFKKVALMNAMIDFDIIATENIEEIIC